MNLKQLWSIIRGRQTNFRCLNASWTYYPNGDPMSRPNDRIVAYAAWHPTKGFDEHHYEGPIAFADLEEEGGVIEVVKDLNDTEGTNEWRAVKVEIRRLP